MEISIVTDGKCSFTGEQHPIVISVVDQDGNKIFMSKQFLEMSKRIFDAVSGALSPTPQPKPVPQKQVQNIVGPAVEKSCAINCADEDDIEVENTPQIKRNVPQIKSDPAKIDVFLKEIAKQRERFFAENESKEDDGGLNEIIIKRAVKIKKMSIAKDDIYNALRRVVPMNKERFDLVYDMSDYVE